MAAIRTTPHASTRPSEAVHTQRASLMTVKNRLMVLIGTAAAGILLLLALLVRDISAAYDAPSSTVPGILIFAAAIAAFLLVVLAFTAAKTTHSFLETLKGEPENLAAIVHNAAADDLSNRSESDGALAAIGKAMAIVEFDLDGTITAANDNFLQAMGYTLAEIKGRHHSQFVDAAEASGTAHRQLWEKLRSGQYDAGQYRRVGKGGREVWLQASYTPILDAAGRPLKVVEFASDVTDQVRTAEEVRTLAQAAADGDLTRRIPTAGKSGNVLSLSQAINSMADGMTTMVSQIRAAVEAVRTGTDEISKGNTNLSQRTEEQASSLEQTASSMEEMTSTVKQNADNAAQANQLATAARTQAEKGGEVVAEAVAAMASINEASSKIADIIGVIDEIAFQTNLLALNAAVEAARAGEQGRGFAVVAGEVRTLASRSASAAKEIKALIQDSVSRVGHGTRLVGQSGQSLADIVAAVKKASDIVAEIAAACQEQASGIDQVNRAINSLDQVTQQNAALVEEAASAAESLSEEAQNLEGVMANYRVAGQVGSVAHEAAAGDGVRAAAVATPRQNAGAGARRPGPPGGIERRKVARPWADRAAGGGRAAAPSADTDWKEF
jgi:methyl-accepting chemotaxis protein